MDYEKAYKEALERMKSWVRSEHPECFTEAQKAAEFVFPELKESKKKWIEKIRQELKSYLGNRKIERISESDAINQWLAWIENQGEKTIPNMSNNNDNDIDVCETCVDRQHCSKSDYVKSHCCMRE